MWIGCGALGSVLDDDWLVARNEEAMWEAVVVRFMKGSSWPANGASQHLLGRFSRRLQCPASPSPSGASLRRGVAPVACSNSSSSSSSSSSNSSSSSSGRVICCSQTDSSIVSGKISNNFLNIDESWYYIRNSRCTGNLKLFLIFKKYCGLSIYISS